VATVAALLLPFVDGWLSNRFTHDYVGIAERRHRLESRLFEHRYRSMSGRIAEGFTFPILDRVSFDDSAALPFYGFESGCQRGAGDSPAAIFFVHDKTSDAPEFSGFHFRGLHAIRTIAVNARQLLSRSVLTPSDWCTVRVNQDSVRATLRDKFLLFAAISRGSQFPGGQPLILGQWARALEMHAPAMVPAIALGEQLYEVRPDLLRHFFRRQFHRRAVIRSCRFHFNRISLCTRESLNRPQQGGGDSQEF
jgi:hypothetical protein